MNMTAEEFVIDALNKIDNTIELAKMDIENATTSDEEELGKISKSYLEGAKEVISTIWNFAQKEREESNHDSI